MIFYPSFIYMSVPLIGVRRVCTESVRRYDGIEVIYARRLTQIYHELTFIGHRKSQHQHISSLPATGM